MCKSVWWKLLHVRVCTMGSNKTSTDNFCGVKVVSRRDSGHIVTHENVIFA